MQFNVAQLLKEPTGSTRQYELEEDIGDLDPEITAIAPLRGRLKFTRTGQGLLAIGRLHTEVTVSCVRCLEQARVSIDFEVEEELIPSVDVATGARLPTAGQDQAVIIDAQHIMDLRELIRQDILLALPSHPLCRPDCRGLCVQCGQNLNEGPCECQPPIDERWAELGALLEDEDLVLDSRG